MERIRRGFRLPRASWEVLRSDKELGDGLRLAGSKLGKIAGWAAISATVGLILRSLEERFGFLGDLIVGLIGVVWGAITFFVVRPPERAGGSGRGHQAIGLDLQTAVSKLPYTGTRPPEPPEALSMSPISRAPFGPGSARPTMPRIPRALAARREEPPAGGHDPSRLQVGDAEEARYERETG
jgi:Family of unknown function (DUF6159)